MLCEKCKIREANIKYTEIINGVKTEHNLCSVPGKWILDSMALCSTGNFLWEGFFPAF